MSNQIILDADEKVLCPKCSHEFTLQDGITRQTMDRHANAFDELLRKKREELEVHINQQANKKANESVQTTLDELNEKVKAATQATATARAEIQKAKDEAIERYKEEIDLERKAMVEDLAAKNEVINKFRVQELELRKQKSALEEQQQNMEIELQRKLDEERKSIEIRAVEKETIRFEEREAELKKKIEDATKANDLLRQKLDQGSNQLHGEVLELEVENSLTSSYFHDLIQEVPKGVRGADVIQVVRTATGIEVGKIIWEAKNAASWGKNWIEKLKSDQNDANANVAILVTTVMPKPNTGAFCKIDDIWVISPQLVKPMSEALRHMLLEQYKIKVAEAGKEEKAIELYNFISSPQFDRYIRDVFDTFTAMQKSLAQEKRAMTKIWKARETQINKLTGSMGSIVGHMQGITMSTLPALNSIDTLEEIDMDLIEDQSEE